MNNVFSKNLGKLRKFGCDFCVIKQSTLTQVAREKKPT